MELTVSDVKQFFYNSIRIFEEYKEKLNAINVFPVPDGDTGTNMYSTLKGIWEKIKDIEVTSVGKLFEKIAEGAMENAQGNSGNILAMFFYGMYEALKDKDKITIKEFASAVEKGYEYARSAVANPKEGTILSAIRALAESFKEEKENFIYAIKNAINTAIFYLETYKEEVKSLKENGVLDAGGIGFLLLLKGWLISKNSNIYVNIDKYLNKTIKRKLIGEYCINIALRSNENEKVIKRELEKIGDSVVVKKLKDRILIHVHHKDVEFIKRIVNKYGAILKINISQI